MTIEEAMKQLRVVIPRDTRSVCITVEVWEYTHLPDGPTIEFRVWDGCGHHKGPSLKIAVSKCLLANITPDQANIIEVEAAAVEAAALQAAGAQL